MSIKIKAPTFPESVADGTIANWVKKEGDNVSQDDVIAEIETDKVVLEVIAQTDGRISKIIKDEGEIVQSSEVIGEFDELSDISEVKEKIEEKVEEKVQDKKEQKKEEPPDKTENVRKIGPAAKKIISEENIDSNEIKSSGKGNRITKADVINHMNSKNEESSAVISSSFNDDRPEKRVPMSRLRSTIAKRLVSVKQETAMLTTFNEVDMLPIKELRSKYGTEFEKEHGVKLGFMGFFVIAAVQALKKFPVVNASIDGDDIVYHGFQDIGVAVSTERGLVVPVVRNVQNLTIAEIELSIRDLSLKARDGKLDIEDMTGGTFTVSNGGVFGSLLSTPILNPPQSAILGMHKIQDRPMVVDGNIEIRPMMYLALTYDHRLLDGKDAVSFLVKIKESLESPESMMLGI